jgi:hypothetical protein
MGEFELALVFFHRGKKVRPDVREFQLGINKAQEAIDNCVGGKIFLNYLNSVLYFDSLVCSVKDPESVKLEVKGDLSYFDKPDEVRFLRISTCTVQLYNYNDTDCTVFLFTSTFFCF